MNDLELVHDVVDRLAQDGVHVWVSGGWAEQLLGHQPARQHLDVDLLYPAESWAAVDALDLAWVGKPQPHRRAFAHEDVLIELFLVRRDAKGHYTDFPDGRHRWPAGLLWGVHGLRVARAA
jgi:Aminoglycoside-2''-adenylyltransferase